MIPKNMSSATEKSSVVGQSENEANVCVTQCRGESKASFSFIKNSRLEDAQLSLFPVLKNSVKVKLPRLI